MFSFVLISPRAVHMALRQMIYEKGITHFDQSLLDNLHRSPRPAKETEIAAELRQMGSPENLSRFEQLFRSVLREPKTPPPNAQG